MTGKEILYPNFFAVVEITVAGSCSGSPTYDKGNRINVNCSVERQAKLQERMGNSPHGKGFDSSSTSSQSTFRVLTYSELYV